MLYNHGMHGWHKVLFLFLTGIFLFFFLTQLFFGITSISIPKKVTLTLSPSPAPQKREASISFKTPSIESIFAKDHDWIATLSAKHVRILTATGDVIPARSVNYGVVRRNNPLWPYEKVAPILKTKKTDITLINLETPLLKNCPTTVEGMIFCGTAKNIEGLKAINVTVANLANNHAGNHGNAGVEETKNLLHENGILTTGITNPAYQDVRGIRFAFLGYNDITKPQPGIANASEAAIKKEIALAQRTADIVVVTFHWGVEYQAQPDEDQKRLGRLAIDSGADLVIGNHPHWIQPIEFYKGRLITYAHGNFIFDQMWSQKTREGVIGRYIFYDKKLIDVVYMPLQINDYGQAIFTEDKQANAILNDMKKQSQILEKAE